MQLSATQIVEFRLCPRKWAWQKLDRVEKKSNPSAELGTRVHTVLENWLKNGTVIDVSTEEGRIAASGIQHLPTPGSVELEVEEWIELYTDVAVFLGKVDLQYRNPETGRIVIHDHKTTSDLKWAKDEDDLRRDPQSLIYAAEAMARHGASEVELSWLYMTTRGKNKSKRVHLTLVRDEVEKGLDVGFPEEGIESVNETARKMLEIEASGKKALDLPPTVSACSAFGGCAHVDLCKLTAMDFMRATMAQAQAGETAIEKFKRVQAEKKAAEAAAAAGGGAAPATTGVAREKPGINPPEAKTTPATTTPAAAPSNGTKTTPVPAGLDLSPLTAALEKAVAKFAPRDLRDEMVIAILSSGNVELFEDAYKMVDDVLSRRGGK